MKNTKIICGYNNINNYPCFKYEHLFAPKQLDMFRREYMQDKLELFVNSPYILNYLNLLILNGELDFDSLSITFVDENGDTQDLKILNEKLVNTSFHSDTIDWIYDKYSNFKQKTMEQQRQYRYCLNAIRKMQSFYEVDCWLRTTEYGYGEEDVIFLTYSHKNEEQGLTLDENNDWVKLIHNLWGEFGKTYNSSLVIFNKNNPQYNSFHLLDSIDTETNNCEFFPFNKQ